MSGITNPSEKYFKDGLWTYDGTVWRPQNQLLAYRNTLRSSYGNADAAAGVIIWGNAAVPTGEVHVYTSIIAHNATTAAAYLMFADVNTGVSYVFATSQYNAVSRYLGWSGVNVLKAGESLIVIFLGTALHDALYGYAVGYKFLIAE